MKINLNVLKAFHACDHYLRAFVRLFPRREYPDGVEVTADLCVRHAGDFDWDWAAEFLLTEVGRDLFEDTVDGDSAYQLTSQKMRDAHRAYDLEIEGWRQTYGYGNASDEATNAYHAVSKRYGQVIEKLNLEHDTVTANTFARLSHDHESPKVALAFAGHSVDDLDDDDDDD